MIDITQENFQEEVLDSPIPVLVDCWHESCGPCLRFMEDLAKIDEDYPLVKVVKLDVFDNSRLARDFSITSVPTFLIFRNGKVTERIVGTAKKALYAALDNL